MLKVIPSFRISWKLLLLGCCVSCSSSKDVVVQLTTTANLSREMGQSFWTTNPIAADSSTVAYARQLELEAYIVTQFLHRPWEQLYQKWKDGKGDTAAFGSTLRRFMKEAVINTSLPPVDNESRFLFGRRKNGEYVVIADENNNNSFLDDSLRRVEPIIGKSKSDMATKPTSIRITNLRGYDKEGVFMFSATVDLQPVVASEAPRPAYYDFYLNLLSSESAMGYFRYKGKSHKVAMRNCGFPIFNNKPEFELLKFAAGNEDSAFLKRWNTRPEYRVGDTVALAKHVFLIKDASSLQASVTLKPMRMSPNKVRPKRIYSSLETTASNLDQK